MAAARSIANRILKNGIYIPATFSVKGKQPLP